MKLQPYLNRTVCMPALLAALSLPLIGHTQTAPAPDNGGTAASSPATQTPASGLPWAEAEVRRIDTAAGKISLRHGEIKNLDMPPMTMVFQVREPDRLGGLSVGDRVRFTADQLQGAYTVLDIEKRP